MSSRALPAAIVAGLLALIGVTPVAAAVPRLIMVYGAPLAQPVILDNWVENGYILGVDEPNVTPDDLVGRPYLHLALFWGADNYIR